MLGPAGMDLDRQETLDPAKLTWEYGSVSHGWQKSCLWTPVAEMAKGGSGRYSRALTKSYAGLSSRLSWSDDGSLFPMYTKRQSDLGDQLPCT